MYILVETSQQSTEVFQYFSLLYCSVLVLYISDVWGCYVVNGRELIVRHSVPRGERGHSTRLHQLKSVGHPLPFVAKETNNCNFAPSVVDQLCVHSQGFVFTFKALCSYSRLCLVTTWCLGFRTIRLLEDIRKDTQTAKQILIKKLCDKGIWLWKENNDKWKQL